MLNCPRTLSPAPALCPSPPSTPLYPPLSPSLRRASPPASTSPSTVCSATRRWTGRTSQSSTRWKVGGPYQGRHSTPCLSGACASVPPRWKGMGSMLFLHSLAACCSLPPSGCGRFCPAAELPRSEPILLGARLLLHNHSAWVPHHRQRAAASSSL